jgi:hypothetical protein
MTCTIHIEYSYLQIYQNSYPINQGLTSMTTNPINQQYGTSKENVRDTKETLSAKNIKKCEFAR